MTTPRIAGTVTEPYFRLAGNVVSRKHTRRTRAIPDMPATPVGVHSAARRGGDMATIAQHAITEVLGELRDGVPGALDRLIPLVYEDLTRIAHRQLGLEGAGHTLSTSALVHEAYLRLVDQTRAHWADRAQFYAVAAHVMRRVLVDHARRHRAARRGGANPRSISLDALDSKDAGSLAVDDRADILLAIDEALDQLAMLDARQARVVDCRFFGGLTETETAEALGVTTRTVERDWVKARGWLYQELSNDAP